MKLNKTTIIAEAGVNHDGILNKAFKLALKAKRCNADYVKFQAFNPNLLSTKNAKKANYQLKYSRKENQFDMLNRLSLKKKEILSIQKYCKKIKIGLMFSVFDEESYKLINELQPKYIKIPSGEITNYPLIKSLKKQKSKVIFSTGLSNLNEIKKCFKLLRYKKKISQIVIMHCNTEYPTPLKDINLRVIPEFKKIFNCQIGFSDHSTSTLIPAVAVSMGATYVEKHFTLNKNSKGPDHKASLEPREFREMVDNIRNVEKSLGEKIKKITNSEKKNLIVVRKSIVAKRDIEKGEKFNTNNITTKRPGNGLSPMNWTKIINRTSKRKYNKDDFILDE